MSKKQGSERTDKWNLVAERNGKVHHYLIRDGSYALCVWKRKFEKPLYTSFRLRIVPA